MKWIGRVRWPYAVVALSVALTALGAWRTVERLATSTGTAATTNATVIALFRRANSVEGRVRYEVEGRVIDGRVDATQALVVGDEVRLRYEVDRPGNAWLAGGAPRRSSSLPATTLLVLGVAGLASSALPVRRVWRERVPTGPSPEDLEWKAIVDRLEQEQRQRRGGR